MKELLTEFFASILTEKTDELDAYGKTTIDGEVVYVYGPSSRPKKDRVPSNATHFAKPGQTQSKQPLSVKQKAQIAKQPAGKPSAKKKAVAKKKTARRSATTAVSQTRRPSKATASDVAAARRVYPGARRVSVVDTISDSEITAVMDALGIPTGEDETLPADMVPKKRDYASRGLTGHHSDKSYYDRMRAGGMTVRKPLFKMPDNMRNKLIARGFPLRYIQLLERAMNVQVKGQEPKFSDMIDGVGAGKNASQFGEVMSMAMIAVPPELREEFARLMNKEIEKSKLAFLKEQLTDKEFKALTIAPRGETPQQKKERERKLNKALAKVKTVGDSKWIKAASDHADAFDSYMDSIYGEGNWRLEGTAWDRREDIEGMGLDYENKGFSTDALFRVQPLTRDGKPKGPAQVVRASLKKDENVMLFNGGVGEIENLVRTSYLSPNKRKFYTLLEQIYSLLDDKKSKEQREGALASLKRILKLGDEPLSPKEARKLIKAKLEEIDAEAKEKASPEVVGVLDRVRTFTEDQKNNALKMGRGVAKTNNATPSALKKAAEAAAQRNAKNGWDAGEMLASYKIVKDCSKQTKDNATFEACISKKVGSAADRISKCCTLAAALAAELEGGARFRRELDAHINLAVELGRDYMALFSRENPEMLASLMGVLRQKFPMGTVMGGGEMMLIDGVHVGTQTLQTVFGVDNYDELELGLKLIEVDGQIMLAYVNEKDGRTVVIGAVDCRQKGAGYASVGFEIKCSEEFVLESAKANRENGVKSDSNGAAIGRITRRIESRGEGEVDQEAEEEN